MTQINLERIFKNISKTRGEYVNQCIENGETTSFQSDTEYAQTLALISIAQSLEKIANRKE